MGPVPGRHDGTGGAITAGNTWWYFKFGDTTKPALSDSATWYLLVTLKPIDGADQTTQNNASPPAVTIMDMTGALNPGTFTSAFRVHNGAATGATDARRIEATNSGGTDVWSLSRTENNAVAQGYGTDTTGDFELAVPVGMALTPRSRTSSGRRPPRASAGRLPTSTSPSAQPTPRRRPRRRR